MGDRLPDACAMNRVKHRFVRPLSRRYHSRANPFEQTSEDGRCGAMKSKALKAKAGARKSEVSVDDSSIA
jgi:hypothetical protein